MLFQARKAWAKGNYQRPLDLLQCHQICVDPASSLDEFKMCRKDKNKARKSLKWGYRAYMNKVRNQLGLPARAGSPDANGRRLDPLAVDQAASRAATPGSTLPSSSSRLAPPPVEM